MMVKNTVLNDVEKVFAHYTDFGGGRVDAGHTGGKAVWISLAVCAAYAVSDELHQHFVTGRGPEFTDVLIDCLGSAIGIFIFAVLLRKRAAGSMKSFK